MKNKLILVELPDIENEIVGEIDTSTKIAFLSGFRKCLDTLKQNSVRVDVGKLNRIINEQERCPCCDNIGYTVEQSRVETRITRDMAIDAGDRSLEGQTYEQAEFEQVQCQFCYENPNSIFNLGNKIKTALESGELCEERKP